jgi:hypothetical protein
VQARTILINKKSWFLSLRLLHSGFGHGITICEITSCEVLSRRVKSKLLTFCTLQAMHMDHGWEQIDEFFQEFMRETLVFCSLRLLLPT